MSDETNDKMDDEDDGKPGRKATKSQQQRQDLLDLALGIAKGYGGNLTLRQLYYRLVAGGHIPSSQKAYKQVGDIIANARLDGSFPLSWLCDRTREAKEGDVTNTWLDVADSARAAARTLHSLPTKFIRQAVWRNQSEYVMVAVEKEALAGVFEGPCNALGVPWLVCRGYPSISTAYETATHYREATEHRGRPYDDFVIIYFGDHDPDGLEIPDSLARQVAKVLDRLMEDEGGVEDMPMPRVERVALTRAQIKQFNPPPFPAKESSSRYAAYVKKTGLKQAWELDALDPSVLTKLIKDSVTAHFDQDLWLEGVEEVLERRAEFIEELKLPNWLDNALKNVDLTADLVSPKGKYKP
jgi:hypothetical protein